MSAQIRDMTKGSPAKLILLFAVPLMLGNIFQQLYTMVDTIVVGQVAEYRLLPHSVLSNGSCGWFLVFPQVSHRDFLF